jgi:hypothetical protein
MGPAACPGRCQFPRTRKRPRTRTRPATLIFLFMVMLLVYKPNARTRKAAICPRVTSAAGQ